MNSKITQALSDVSSGDITAYYNEVDKKNLPNYIKWGALIFSKNLDSSFLKR
jgi:hypothetical protein